MNRSINYIFLVVFIIILYLLFPTQNSVIDAYSYAGQVKYAVDLYHPHHLLHNPLNYYILETLNFIGFEIDALNLGKFINSLFVLGSCLVLFEIISNFISDKKSVFLLTLIVLFSYGTWRFGTENEVYIEPIFFSITGSFYFLKFIQTKKFFFLCWTGIFAATACLFHQIHFFWWLGLLIGAIYFSNFIKSFSIFFLTGLIVPITYFLVISIVLQQNLNLENILHFVLHDFYQGSADTAFNLRGLIMTPISLVRSFVQVHPIVWILIKSNLFYVIPLAVIFLLIISISISKERKLNFHKNPTNSSFLYTHILILILQFGFAVFAKGNVEFMVMIPFLLIIIISAYLSFSNSFLFKIVLILFVWNFSFGIYPNHRYQFYDDRQFVDYLIQNSEEKVILKNLVTRSKYFYETGKSTENFIIHEKLNQSEFNSIIYENKSILTDVIDYPDIFNRQKFMNSTNNGGGIY
ncbi:MAG: hypothetical protein Q4G27_07165 [Flavobacteriaceae bacterium]|nr:hypothetical protein [Flavobacteriaceae bacterium]